MKTNSKKKIERSFHVNYKIIFDDDDNIVKVAPSLLSIKNIKPTMAVFAIISIMFQLISNITKHWAQAGIGSHDDLKAKLMKEMLKKIKTRAKAYLSE
jgi:hypothetical protein